MQRFYFKKLVLGDSIIWECCVLQCEIWKAIKQIYLQILYETLFLVFVCVKNYKPNDSVKLCIYVRQLSDTKNLHQ
jgi:hypothetical protein